jgi:hypothetical protein
VPPPSRASPLPQGPAALTQIGHTTKLLVGACLQAIAVGQAAWILNGLTPSRASSLPQGLGCGPRYLLHPRTTVGAWLARESGGSGSTDVEWADAFASKLAPTGSGGVHSNRAHHKIIVGACLQAIAVDQATWILNGLAPSRAGSLPQGLGGGSRYPVHPAPTGIGVWIKIFASPSNHCGSGACPRKRWVRQHRC